MVLSLGHSLKKVGLRQTRYGSVSTVRTYLKAITYVDEICSNYVYSTGFAVLSPNEELIPKFLLNFVKSNSFTHQVDVVAKGMSYPAINSTELSNLWVSFPDIETQEKIVEFLDQQTSEIDQAIAIKEQQIALLNERKQIVIQKAVSQGLNPNVAMKDSGVEWIGQIPAHWETSKIRYLGTTQNGISAGGDYFGTGYPFVSYSDVYKNRVLPECVEGLANSRQSKT